MRLNLAVCPIVAVPGAGPSVLPVFPSLFTKHGPSVFTEGDKKYRRMTENELNFIVAIANIF